MHYNPSVLEAFNSVEHCANFFFCIHFFLLLSPNYLVSNFILFKFLQLSWLEVYKVLVYNDSESDDFEMDSGRDDPGSSLLENIV